MQTGTRQNTSTYCPAHLTHLRLVYWPPHQVQLLSWPRGSFWELSMTGQLEKQQNSKS